jgi:hypothetical protein
MIKYSTNQLINDNELKYIDTLCNKVHRVEKDDRHYFVYTLNDDDKNVFFKKILKWVETTENIQLHNYDSNLYDCYLINYGKNDFFDKHKDNDYISKTTSIRKFVVGFHLNSNYEEGEFVLYNNSVKTNILKNPGVSYLFDCDIEHAVLPIKEGVRKSIVLFINEEHIKLNKIKSII